MTWEPLPDVDLNGILSTYEVRLQSMSLMGGVMVRDGEEVRVNSSGLNVTVNGLEGFVRYSVTVRARTVVGAGPYSSPPINITTEQGSE